MTQVPIDDLDPRSRSKVNVKFTKEWVKNQGNGHISEAISPTDFLLGTKVQSNKSHLMTQVPTVKVKFSGKLVKKT